MKNHGESARILGAGFFFADPDHEIGIVNLLLVLLALRKHPNKQAVFLDVGMNTGFFSNLMAAQGAEVHAFETQPRCFKYASSALSASGLSSQSVFLYNAGLTDSPGSILQSTQGCDGSNNALSKKSVSLKHIQSWGGGSKRVPTFVLDDSMPASCAPHIFAVKMDTEGAEVMILRGMRKLLKRIDNLQVELGPMYWKNYGVTPADGVALLKQLTNSFGYDAYLMWHVRHDREGRPLSGTGPDLAAGAHPAGAQCTGSSATLRPVLDWQALVTCCMEQNSGANIWFTRQFARK